MKKVIKLFCVMIILVFNVYLMTACRTSDDTTDVTYIDDNNCMYTIGIKSLMH